MPDLVPLQGLLLSCNSMSAEYLFMTDKLYDIGYDTGDKVIQCGRHNDIFKLWLQWRSEGDSGFEARMDRLMELTSYEVKRIKEQSDKFYLIMEPELVNVSFWYIPKRLRGTPHNKQREEELAKVKRWRKQNILFETQFEIDFRSAQSSKLAWCSREHWWSAINRMIVVPTSSDQSSRLLPSPRRTSTSCWTRSTTWAKICK